MNERLKRLLIDVLVAVCSVIVGFFGSSTLSSCGSTWHFDSKLEIEQPSDKDGLSVGIKPFYGFDDS